MAIFLLSSHGYYYFLQLVGIKCMDFSCVNIKTTYKLFPKRIIITELSDFRKH